MDNALKPVFQNSLKAVNMDDPDYIRVKNHIVLWGSSVKKDLEGIFSPRVNDDGSIGEFFTKSTDFKSAYTEAGRLEIDWEHGRDATPETPDRHDILGYVDWKTAEITDEGLLVERLLDRHHTYIQFLEKWGFFKNGLLATSSEPVQEGVLKKGNGEIARWPFYRDSITLTPMDHHMYRDVNMLKEAKSIGMNLAIPEGTDTKTEMDTSREVKFRENMLELRFKLMEADF